MRILDNYIPTHKAGRIALARPAIGAIALIALLLSGCDNFSPVDYFLDHTAVVTVTGAEGRSASRGRASGIDIAPGTSVIALKLDNSRDIPLTLSLDAPRLNSGGGAISCAVTQNGAGEALITIHGAVVYDEFALTLRIGGDGRDFDPYTFSVRCPEYTVTFDTQGFGAAQTAQTAILFGFVSDPGDPSAAGDPAFLGWHKESACVNPWNFGSDTVSGNTTLYAGWNATHYTVTFNTQSHGTAPTSVPVYSGGLVTAPSVPSETGWTFGGWFTDAACNTAYTFANPVSDSITLYAKWTATSYTITYTLNGGTNHASNPANYTIESSAITLQAPTKTGYQFNGWYTDSGFTTAAASPAIAAGSTGNKAFYARWNTGGGITITQPPGSSGRNITASGSTSINWSNGTVTFNIDNTVGLSAISWLVNGHTVNGNILTITPNSTSNGYGLQAAPYTISVYFTLNGVMYSEESTLTVNAN
ncbi:InlB B-repeat-containing protein [Breznakiellaceae bacterium SP9]